MSQAGSILQLSQLDLVDLTNQSTAYISQVGSNLRLSQLHPLRPNHIDQSHGSELSSHRNTDTHTDRPDGEADRP